MSEQRGFFDFDDRLKRLSALGDQLLSFAGAVDFELFRPELLRALAYSDGARDGRPPFDPVMMFKVLIIQAANSLSDERTEFLINDRLSFMRFLGLSLSDRVPEEWRAKPAKLRQKDRDARWKVKFSKAKARAGGTRAAVDIAQATLEIGMANLVYNIRGSSISGDRPPSDRRRRNQRASPAQWGQRHPFRRSTTDKQPRKQKQRSNSER